MRRRFLRAVALLLCFAQLISFLPASVTYAVPDKTFTIEQAQSLALQTSPEIKKMYNNILIKKMKFTEAVKGIQMKAKNKRTFRWSPLITFKFPEKLNLVEDFELYMKPIALTAEIISLQHGMNDQRFAVISEVNIAFFKAYVLQETVEFKEEILILQNDELNRNIARLATGEAKQGDIDKMEKAVETLTAEIAQLKRNFQSAKQDLTDLVKLDVTTGYRFAPPLKNAEISREKLEEIVEYTLNNDQVVYEARSAESLALLALNQYEKLMRKQYGGKMKRMDSYLNSFKNGNEVDTSAFKTEYDAMVKTFDKPWDGKFRILFITFTKEFLKGQISGTRYIEDEMYALYTGCLEYQGARKEREKAEKALIKQVNSEYEALVTAKNAAFGMMKTQEETREQLDRLSTLNKIGKAEYEEVNEKQGDYQAIQLDAIDAMSVYNELLAGFDRLTCGAITMLLKGQGMDTDAGDSALSLPAEDAYYYIYNDISDLSFVFGLDIPEEYEPEISHYEIWYENVQIGTKTEKDKRIRHLTLVNGDSDFLTVRVFNDDEYVGECVIDTTTPRAKLPLEKKDKEAPEEPTERKIGTYKVSTTITGGLSLSKITMSFDAAESVGFYKIVYGENDVYNAELIPETEGFTYLTLLITALEDVDILVFDKSEQQMGNARFDTSNQTIQLLINNE